MDKLLEEITLAKAEDKDLFYNNEGSKQAYQLGIKHINSAEHLGYTLSLPNGDLLIQKKLLLVDFERNKIVEILKGSRISPIKLKFL